MLRRPLVAAGIAGALLLSATGIAGATADVKVNRLSGPNRYETSVAVASATFQSQPTVALIANGHSPADAIAASYVSGVSRAPLLLTEGNRANPGVIAALKGLKVEGVVLVGGAAALSGDVHVQLEEAGFGVERVQGADRYETARMLAELFPGDAVGVFGSGRAVFLARGDSFADALAAGPLSAAHGMPILLTTSGALHPQTKAALQGSLGIKHVVLLGGTTAIAESVIDELKALGLTTERIAGTNRQDTAVQLARVAFNELGFPKGRVLLARGDGNDFADALAGGSRGGQVGAPLLLTSGVNDLGAATQDFLKANSATIGDIDVLGGTGAVSEATANAALAAARGS